MLKQIRILYKAYIGYKKAFQSQIAHAMVSIFHISDDYTGTTRYTVAH